MPAELRGLRILLVEDNFLLADITREFLEECGCEIIGPVSRLETALEVAAHIQLDGALLDIDLAGEYSFPLAELLQTRGVPFMFLTGYNDTIIPPAFKQAPRMRKPFDLGEVAAAAARHFGAR